MSTNVSYADETAIRDHYARMLACWGDATAYAECFTPDADYIIANGMIEHGWQQIVEGHAIIFSAWARNSRLVGRVESIRFITADVALLIAHGHIEYMDHRSSADNKRTVYSLVAQRFDDRWLFAAYQNTPLGGH